MNCEFISVKIQVYLSRDTISSSDELSLTSSCRLIARTPRAIRHFACCTRNVAIALRAAPLNASRSYPGKHSPASVRLAMKTEHGLEVRRSERLMRIRKQFFICPISRNLTPNTYAYGCSSRDTHQQPADSQRSKFEGHAIRTTRKCQPSFLTREMIA